MEYRMWWTEVERSDLLGMNVAENYEKLMSECCRCRVLLQRKFLYLKCSNYKEVKESSYYITSLPGPRQFVSH